MLPSTERDSPASKRLPSTVWPSDPSSYDSKLSRVIGTCESAAGTTIIAASCSRTARRPASMPSLSSSVCPVSLLPDIASGRFVRSAGSSADSVSSVPKPMVAAMPTTPSSVVTTPASVVRAKNASAVPAATVAVTYQRRKAKYQVRNTGAGANDSTHSLTLAIWSSDRPVSRAAVSPRSSVTAGFVERFRMYAPRPPANSTAPTATARGGLSTRASSVAPTSESAVSARNRVGSPTTSLR